MGVAYSQDLRDRVLSAYRRGMKTLQIAEVFEVSPAWARRVKQRLQQLGETSPRKTGFPASARSTASGWPGWSANGPTRRSRSCAGCWGADILGASSRWRFR